MNKVEFEITGDYIELIRLLKAIGIAESGSQAKDFVKEGIVMVNGIVETQLRKKLKKSDVVEIDGNIITIK